MINLSHNSERMSTKRMGVERIYFGEILPPIFRIENLSEICSNDINAGAKNKREENLSMLWFLYVVERS